MTLTPLSAWIARGERNHHVVKRLEHASTLLTEETLARMRAVGETFVEAPYDECFQWSDQEIYCSELVWKIYHRALGLQIGELETLGDFDLSSPLVQRIVAERGCDMPDTMRAISPGAMFDSDKLITVHVSD